MVTSFATNSTSSTGADFRTTISVSSRSCTRGCIRLTDSDKILVYNNVPTSLQILSGYDTPLLSSNTIKQLTQASSDNLIGTQHTSVNQLLYRWDRWEERREGK